MKILEMKGIIRDVGEMNIPLNPNTDHVKQCLYQINPRYKDKIKGELDRMMDAGIIEPVKESEWISPMVVQDNMIGVCARS